MKDYEKPIEILKKHIKRAEKSGDQDSAFELFQVFVFMGKLWRLELENLPLEEKIKIWKSNGIPESCYRQADNATKGIRPATGSGLGLKTSPRGR